MIPATLRKELDLREGDVLDARVERGRLVLQTPQAILERLRGDLRAAAGDRDLVAELLDQRRVEAEREE